MSAPTSSPNPNPNPNPNPLKITPRPEPPRPPIISLVSVAATLVSLLVLVIALKEMRSLLEPFVVAIFFFYLGRPLAAVLVRYRVPTGIANLAIMVVAAAGLALLAWIVGAHVDDLVAKAPQYNRRFQAVIQAAFAWIVAHTPRGGEEVREFFAGLTIPSGPLGTVAGALVGTFVGSLTTLLLVVFYLMFLNQEAGTLPGRIEAAYGRQRAAGILEVGRRINAGIIAYVYVKFVASAVVAVLSTIALVAFEVDLAILWGTLVFFGNFVPYLGSIAAVALPLTIAVVQFGSLGQVLFLGAVLSACQILVAYYLEPMMAGRRFNLSPVVVMLSFAFWGWLWGITGLILAVPIMMALKLVLENIPATRKIAILLSQESASSPDPRDRPTTTTSDGTPGALP